LAIGPILLSAMLVAALGAPGCGSTTPDPSGAASVRQPIVGGVPDPMIAAAGLIVNRYTALAQNATAGATTIAVTNAGALMAAPGDLLFVMQMQGATVDGTNTSAFGTVTALNGAGSFEFVTVASVSTNTITLAPGCGLHNAYSAAGQTQVIWVPQYASLTVTAAGSITAPAWDGATGGVVVIETQSAAVAGAIDVSGKGFRGGALSNFAANPPTATFQYRSTVATDGAEKGESIAGYESDYDVAAIGGRYSLGAIANGGGGGAAHNGGGGGGANGDDGDPWSGTGVVPPNASVPNPWSLDTAIETDAGLLRSSGGGRGGYSFSLNAENPAVVAPGNVLWGGDDRQYRGGLGGRPLASDPSARLFLGGGGGAGNENNGSGGAGGAGGGLVYIVAGSVIGGGAIRADGAAGASTPDMAGAGRDAPGGGGGGGTIVVSSPSLGMLTVTAGGGAGGDQFIQGFGSEAEGPAGGGGGGFIAVPGAGATATFTGGTGGTTDSPTFVTFPQNGATNGAAGDLALLAAAAQPAMCIAADLSVTVTDGVIGVTAGTNVTFTITVHNNGPNPVAGASLSDPFGAAFTGETWTCTGVACPAAAGTGSLSEVLGALPSGAQATFTVVASVSPTATSPLTNTATVAPPSGIVDGTPANNTATTSNALDAASADIGVALTSVSSSVLAAAAYSYAVEVTNAGPSVASGVAATVTLPAGATLGPLPATDATEGWTCAAPVGPSVTCSHVTLLGASESTTLTLDVTAPSLLSASTATLTADVGVTSAVADPATGNNMATLSIPLLCALSSECELGGSCTDAGTCTPAPDAGEADAASSDGGNDGGGALEAGVSDGGDGGSALEAGASESDAGDAGGALEAGVSDGGDAGAALDGGFSDAGDGGPVDGGVDAGSRDGSLGDSGPVDAESAADAATGPDGESIEDGSVSEADTGVASPEPSAVDTTGTLQGGGISCSTAGAPRRTGGTAGLWTAFALIGLWVERRRRPARNRSNGRLAPPDYRGRTRPCPLPDAPRPGIEIPRIPLRRAAEGLASSPMRS
jgi:uncharacterized repeat protein (TIGR01451 family)